MKPLISLPMLLISLLLFSSCRSKREEELFIEARERYEANQKLRAEIKNAKETIRKQKGLMETKKKEIYFLAFDLGQKKAEIDLLKNQNRRLNENINDLNSNQVKKVEDWVKLTFNQLKVKLKSPENLTFADKIEEERLLWAFGFPQLDKLAPTTSTQNHGLLFLALTKNWSPGVEVEIKKGVFFNDFDLNKIVEELDSDLPLLKLVVKNLLDKTLKEFETENPQGRFSKKKLTFIRPIHETFLMKLFKSIKAKQFKNGESFPPHFRLKNLLAMSHQGDTPLADYFRRTSSVHFAKFLVKEGLVSRSWYDDYKNLYALRLSQVLKLD